jgi:hypothetical protein
MIVERLAILLQSALLLQSTPENIAMPWLATRLGGEGGRCFGTLPAWVKTEALMARAWVDVKRECLSALTSGDFDASHNRS